MMTKSEESKLNNIIIIYRLLPKKINSLLKVQNSFLIKDDLIQNSIVLYKKENLSLSREKKRNRSLLDNKAYFFNNYQQNKKYLNIRINTTTNSNINNNNNKNYLKLQNKPLTSSSSENLLSFIAFMSIFETKKSSSSIPSTINLTYTPLYLEIIAICKK